MNLSAFLLDEWLNEKPKFKIEYDLATSTGPQWTVQDLLRIIGEPEQRLMRETKLDYSDAAGDRRLRSEIARFSGVNVEDVQVLTGASEGLLIMFFLAAKPGANVVLPFPGFPPFAEVAKSFGLEIRFYHLLPENQFRVSVDEIRSLADSNTKIILLNSPHNPTGAILSDDEINQIHDYAAERGIQFVVDEVYHPLYMGSGTERRTAALLPKATVLSDLSKSLCFSGLRIGWIIDKDHDRLSQYLNARSYFTISNSPLTEVLATFVMQHSETVLQKANDTIRRNIACLHMFFEESQDVLRWAPPRGGTICFPWLASGENSRKMCEAMRDQGVFLAPGDCFGMPAHFRLGYGACTTDIMPALHKITTFLRQT